MSGTVGDPELDPAEAGYSLTGIRQMLGMSRAVVLGYVKAGFVAPSRGPRNAYRFAFQDVVLLRTAQSLRDANIPSRRIRASLRRLRAELPSAMPLTGLRIVAVGDDVAVREGAQQMAVDTGQLLFDFAIANGNSLVVRLPRAVHRADDASRAASPLDAAIARARQTEERDRPAAVASYREALALAPDRDDLALALGALLHDARRFAEALAVYEAAIARRSDVAALHFNRAVVLEDLQRFDEAVAGYERCLAVEPDFADAHWNAARLYEKADRPQQALRHFSAFRRLRRS